LRGRQQHRRVSTYACRCANDGCWVVERADRCIDAACAVSAAEVVRYGRMCCCCCWVAPSMHTLLQQRVQDLVPGLYGLRNVPQCLNQSARVVQRCACRTATSACGNLGWHCVQNPGLHGQHGHQHTTACGTLSRMTACTLHTMTARLLLACLWMQMPAACSGHIRDTDARVQAKLPLLRCASASVGVMLRTCTGRGKLAPNWCAMLMTTLPPKECPTSMFGNMRSCRNKLSTSRADDSTVWGPTAAWPPAAAADSPWQRRSTTTTCHVGKPCEPDMQAEEGMSWARTHKVGLHKRVCCCCCSPPRACVRSC
jgi:hypothetical protein